MSGIFVQQLPGFRTVFHNRLLWSRIYSQKIFHGKRFVGLDPAGERARARGTFLFINIWQKISLKKIIKKKFLVLLFFLHCLSNVDARGTPDQMKVE